MLKTTLLGEADELVSLYTRNFGKLLVRARGTKKITSKQGAFLQEPAICQCSITLARAGYLLSGIKSIRAYPAISDNLYALGYVMSFLNLCDRLIYEAETDEALWQLLVSVLEDCKKVGFAQEKERGEYLWRREKFWLLSLLDILGVKPSKMSLNHIKTSTHLDLELKKLFEQKFNCSVVFFGLRAFGSRVVKA